METEQIPQILSITKQGRQLQQVAPVDNAEFTPPPQKGLNLRPLLRTVQRQALIVIGITGLVAGAAWYLNKKSPPTYQGSFQLLVEPVSSEAKMSEPSALARTEGDAPNEKLFSLDYPTQVEILKGPGMLSKIVEDVRAKHPGFSIGNLYANLTIERIGKTRLNQTKILQVSYQGSDPKVVQLVLEKTAEKYLKYSLEERKSRIGEGVKFIDARLPDLQTRVNTVQSQIQKLQEKYALTDPKQKSDELFTQVREISVQQSDTQRQIQELRALYTSLQQQLDLTPQEALAASTLSENPNYQGLLTKLKETESQIAVESARFQPGNPYIQALVAQRQQLVDLLNQEAQRILGSNLTDSVNTSEIMNFQNSTRLELIKQLVATANQLQVLEVRDQGIAQTKATLQMQAQQFPAIASQYSELQRQLDIATRTLDQLLSHRQKLEVEEAQNEVPWELISKPELPKDATGNVAAIPSDSSKKLIIGVIAGLVLGMGAAVFLEKFRNIFYSANDIKDAIPLPVLGEIPLNLGERKGSNSRAINGLARQIKDTHNSGSEFLEAFDSLYASIRFLFDDQPVRSLAVCSAEAGDGKSMIALQLAQTAAAMGQRVLLVDADLRQPQLHEWLNLPNSKGLSELLDSELAPNSCVQHSTLAENLFVLTAGQPLPESTRLLASAQMQYLMKEFQTTFDLVVYDTPHLLNLMDANFLASHTDGILMVVALRKTKQSAVKEVLDQISVFGLPTLGTVVNHVPGH
ncbi:MAG: polysaccharide biosynthesis tyrosine autokinase [Microcoleus vaginatus WJT46-NPBG5]|jgi:capsular exopolysaccharide synthesis family protein|nr:polysaccharide biosynthesis tyrosine autokinase [Microcoleus vaginatus WJT46-NPBG5]